MEEVELKPENAPVEAPEEAAATSDQTTAQPDGAPSEPPAAEAEPTPAEPTEAAAEEVAQAEQMVLDAQPVAEQDDTALKAVVEAIVYITEEPVSAAQIAAAIQQPEENVKRVLDDLTADFARSVHGVMIREVAGGYKMTTKPEHHETLRAFVKSLKPPLKLSLAALETLATIAYKQPITAPEIMEIRGVQGAGVLKTLLDRKLIQTAGRKNVIGRPILYRTTKDFLVQFGLKDLAELPTLKEFEELRRLAVSEPESEAPETPAEAPAVAEAAATEQPSGEAPTQPPSETAEATAPEPTAGPSSEPAAAEPPAEGQDA